MNQWYPTERVLSLQNRTIAVLPIYRLHRCSMDRRRDFRRPWIGKPPIFSGVADTNSGWPPPCATNLQFPNWYCAAERFQTQKKENRGMKSDRTVQRLLLPAHLPQSRAVLTGYLKDPVDRAPQQYRAFAEWLSEKQNCRSQWYRNPP